MSATAFAIQSVPHAGLNPVTLTPSLATFTHTAPCGNGVGLMLVNTAGTICAITMRVPAATTFDGLVIPNRTVTLTASANAITIIPLVAATYADPVTLLCTFDVAAGTVSGAVITINP